MKQDSHLNPDAAIENLDCLSNEFTVAADWLKIPYGDHAHGNFIQRFTPAAGEAMASAFQSMSQKLGRFFGGDPVYIGHPDDPKLANDYPDKKAYAWIQDMQARADGLYVKPKWSAPGEELLANAHYKWFSPYWGCKLISNENGKRIVEPVRLISIGLTNNPNIQGILPLANEHPSDPSNPSDPSATQQKGITKPMKDALIKLLSLSNEEQILSAVTQLKADKDAAIAGLANEQTAHAAAKTLAVSASVAQTTAENALANERIARTAKEAELTLQISNQQSATVTARKAHIELILANAITAGKITAAQKPLRAADLLNVEGKDFDAKVVEISNATPVLNTVSKTADLGARKIASGFNRDGVSVRDTVLALVNERITKTKEDYPTAFANIRKEHAALFAEMRQPTKKN